MDKIEIEDVMKVHEIFTSNHWFSKTGHSESYKNFLGMLLNFTNDQKQLLFELCSDYLWITFNEYLELLYQTLDLVDSEKLSQFQRIICFPIIKPEDIQKTKSAAPLIYILKSGGITLPKYQHIRFITIDGGYCTFQKFKFNSTDLLFLVDDFIGTGDTLNSTLKEVEKNPTLIKENLNIIALVTQKEIYEKVSSNDVSFYSTKIRNKGISDKYVSPELERKKELMLQIEELIPNVYDYSFGYKKCEALVTMIRTPNNTFPIFWKSHRKEGKYFKAPFNR